MSYLILDVETTAPLSDVQIPAAHSGLALILRMQGRPGGFLMKEVAANSTVDAGTLAHLIETEMETSQNGRRGPAAESGFQNAATLPDVTVAVCTRNNAPTLANCLDRLLETRRREAQVPLEILVVDNAPSGSHTRDLVTALPGVRYVCEPKPGLNFARNRALREATSELLVFIDDDVLVDRFWLHGLARAVNAHPDAAAFTGLVLPTELETEAQILFEKRGGFEKSFTTIRYESTRPGDPYYPCIGGKFGTGCNMAFRREVLQALGGFDEALDTGAALPGGGDTDMFYRVVRAGYPLIYEPQFMVFHRHRRELKQLRQQYARSWAQGLMAFLAKTYGSDISHRPQVRRLTLWWFETHLRELIASLRGNHILPARMILAELWGGIVGILIAYPRSVSRLKRIRRQFATIHSCQETQG